MGRGGRTTLKRSNNHHVRMKTMESEDSDEDYVAEIDEIDEQSDELDSVVGDVSGDETFIDDEDEDEEGEDEDEDEEEEEEEDWGVVTKPRARKVSTRSRNNGLKRAKKRRVICDDDGESDDDDDEFTPDESELFEEEEEPPPPKRRTKKRGRTTSKRRSSCRRQRSKTNAGVVRRVSRKKTRTANLRREVKSSDDEEFFEKGPSLRTRSKKNQLHRKKRVKVGLDSDSSDYEFTISEEEREQIREANNFCGSLVTNLRSSRRIQEDEFVCKPRKQPLAGKGKEKAEETKNEAGKQVCGICLTEEGKNTVRGTLNCCSHYFCFACIFEWSKVESRCPLCKQRFVSISKPARCAKGFDLRNSVIQIPERDQVYQPTEEELRDFLNPYENVICTECHEGGDDALMLLCDLCDSPAHTYCVGLGRVVPFGNWYCDGCTPAVLGSTNPRSQDASPDRRTTSDAPHGASTYENMAEIDLNVTIPESPLSQSNGFLSSPRYSGGNLQASSPAMGTGVSTVSGRRRIHRRIQVLLSNRLGQMPPGSDVDSLRSLLNVGVPPTFQQSRTTNIGPSHVVEHVDRLQENPTHNVPNLGFIPGRLDRMVGGQASTSTGSTNRNIWLNGLDRMNWGVSQTRIPSSEQLRQYPSRSNVGLEVCVPPTHNLVEDKHRIIQQVNSIVNSQLKSLSQNVNLGHDDYAVISRRAIDTIMVAYGREPPNRDVQQLVRRPCCVHVNGSPFVEMSPMNECCLTCFENFAKDIVKRMLNLTVEPMQGWPFRH